VSAKKARRNDALALLTVIVVIALDQWTKNLVVQQLSPPESHPPIPLIGPFLSIYYLQNAGAAFSMFANTYVLAILIAAAVCLIAFLYARMINSGPLLLKLIFGLIIGGAAGNLIDRAIRGGRVVDFIFFRIPAIGFNFAVFNIADASISVGVFLLFVFILIGGLRKPHPETKSEEEIMAPTTVKKSGTLRSTEQDAQP
jgi:signal peptidase II